MGGAIISYSIHNGVIYNLLFGSTSSTSQIETAKTTVHAFTDTVLGNAILNKVLFFGFWLTVGLVVYTVALGFNFYAGTFVTFWEELHEINSRKKLLQQQFRLRLLLQVIGLLLLTFFTVFFIKIFLPFSILCARISIGQWGNWAGLGYFMAGFTTLLLSFHIFTVLLRFAALRTRLFGNPGS